MIDKGMTNIQLFNKCVAQILGGLYETLPVPIELYEMLEMDQVNEAGESVDKQHNKKIFSATLDWLNSNGLIDIKLGPDGLLHCALTMDGLKSLNAVPESIQSPEISDKETIGGQLVSLIKKDSVEIAMNLVSKHLFGPS